MLSVKLAFSISLLCPVKAIMLKGRHWHSAFSVSFLFLYSSQGERKDLAFMMLP